MFPKNNSQKKNTKMQHAYSNEVYVKCQYLSKRIFWQHHVMGKWNISTLEIAISDSDEYVFCVWATWQCLMGLIRQATRHSHFTVVKRTRVPVGSLVKMATDADVDSGRKMTLIQSVEAYTWNVLSGKIHGGIRNIQCKSRLRGTFHRCTIAPRKNIFWRGCFVFMFCRCRGYLFFSRGYLAYLRGYLRCTRVPDSFLIFITACFTEHWWRKRGNKLVNENFVMKNYVSVSEQLRYIHLILCKIAGTS